MSNNRKTAECSCCGMKFENMTAVFRHIKNLHMDSQPGDQITVEPHTLTIKEKQVQDISSLFDKSPSLKMYKRKESEPSESPAEMDESQPLDNVVITISDEDSDSCVAETHNDDIISPENQKHLQDFVVEMNAKDPAQICEMAHRLNIKENTVKLWLGCIIVSSQHPSGGKELMDLREDTKAELMSFFECNPYASLEKLRSLSEKLEIPTKKVCHWFNYHRNVCLDACRKMIQNRTDAVLLPKARENRLKSLLKVFLNPDFAMYRNIATIIQCSIVDVICWSKKNRTVHKGKVTSAKFLSKANFGSVRKDIVRTFLLNHPEPTEWDYTDLSLKLQVSLEITLKWVSAIKSTIPIPVASAPSELEKSDQLVRVATTAKAPSSDDVCTERKKSLTLKDKLALQKIYQKNPSPSLEEIVRLAAEFNVPRHSIRMWFVYYSKSLVRLGYQKDLHRSSKPKKQTKEMPNASSPVHQDAAGVTVLNQFYSRCREPTESDVEQLSNVLNLHSDAVKVFFNYVRYTEGLTMIKWRTDKEEVNPYALKVLDELYSRTKEPTIPDVDRLSDLLKIHTDAVKLHINYNRHTEGLKWMEWDTGNDLPAKSLRTMSNITETEKQKLLQFYKFKKYPTEIDLKNLATSFGMKVHSVRLWFYHHRRQEGLSWNKKTVAIKKERENVPNKTKRKKMLGNKLNVYSRKKLAEYYAQKKYPTEEAFKRYALELGVKLSSVKLYFYHQREREGLVQLKQIPLKPSKHSNAPPIKREPDLAVDDVKWEKEEDGDVSNQEAAVCVTSLCGISPAVRGKLKGYFRAQRSPSDIELELLAKDLNLTRNVVAAWFVKERSLDGNAIYSEVGDNVRSSLLLEFGGDTESTASSDSFVTRPTADDDGGHPFPVGNPYQSGSSSSSIQENITLAAGERTFDKLHKIAKMKMPGLVHRRISTVLLNKTVCENLGNSSADDVVSTSQDSRECNTTLLGLPDHQQDGRSEGSYVKKTTQDQRDRLGHMFNMNPHPTNKDLKQIAKMIGLSCNQVKGYWGYLSKVTKNHGLQSEKTKQIGNRRSSSDISSEQENMLKQQFSQNCNPCIEELERMSAALGLQEMVVLKWFHREKTKLQLEGSASQQTACSNSNFSSPQVVPLSSLAGLGSVTSPTTYPPPPPPPPMVYTSSQTLCKTGDFSGAVYYHSVSGSIQANMDMTPGLLPGFPRAPSMPSTSVSDVGGGGATGPRLLQIEPQNCQVQYLDTDETSLSHHQPVNEPDDPNNHQIFPYKAESSKTSSGDILVPLNKVARIAPFEGSVKRAFNAEKGGTGDISVLKEEEEPFDKMIHDMYHNIGKNQSYVDNCPVQPIHPHRVVGASTSLYPASLIRNTANVGHTEAAGNSSAVINISPGYTLDTQLIRSGDPQGPPGNPDTHTQATGSFRQFNLGDKQVITIDDSD